MNVKFQLSCGKDSITVEKDATGYYINGEKVSKYYFDLAERVINGSGFVVAKIRSIMDILREYHEDKELELKSRQLEARTNEFWKEFGTLCDKYPDVIKNIFN